MSEVLCKVPRYRRILLISARVIKCLFMSVVVTKEQQRMNKHTKRKGEGSPEKHRATIKQLSDKQFITYLIYNLAILCNMYHIIYDIDCSCVSLPI